MGCYCWDRSTRAADGCTICVEDYELADALEESLRAWKTDGAGGQTVVGYYRSHIESDFKLNLGDQALFRGGISEGLAFGSTRARPSEDRRWNGDVFPG